MPNNITFTPYGILLVTATITASCLLSSGLAYAETSRPLACRTDGELTEDPPVVARSGTFQAGANTYSYRIFGLGALDPDYTVPPYRKCLRYELSNESGNTIQYLRWPDANTRFRNIVGHSRDIFPADRLTSYDATHYQEPVVGKTTLRAFESAESMSETVLTHEQYVQRHGASPNPPPLLFWIDIMRDVPALAESIAEAGIPHQLVQAIRRPEMSREYPKLQSGIVSDDIELLIETSAAYLEHKMFLTVSSTIRAHVPNEPAAAVYAPFFSAMEAYEKELSEDWPMEKKLAGFLGMVEEYRYERLILDGPAYGRIWAFPAAEDLQGAPLFVVNHPVTIVWPDHRVCVDATAYSPVPVSIGGEYCFDE